MTVVALPPTPECLVRKRDGSLFAVVLPMEKTFASTSASTRSWRPGGSIAEGRAAVRENTVPVAAWRTSKAFVMEGAPGEGEEGAGEDIRTTQIRWLALRTVRNGIPVPYVQPNGDSPCLSMSHPAIDWGKYKPNAALLARVKPLGAVDIVMIAGGDGDSPAPAIAPEEKEEEEGAVVDEAEAHLAALNAFGQKVEALAALSRDGLSCLSALEKQYSSATGRMQDLHSQCKHLVEQQVRA